MLYGQDYDWLSELKVSYNQKKHCILLKQWNQDHMLMCMPSLVSDLLWEVVQ